MLNILPSSRRLVRRALVLFFAGAIAGCGGGGGAVTALVQGAAQNAFTSLAVSPVSPAIAVGGAVQITATPRDPSGNPMTGLPAPTWISSAEGIARVNPTGLVTGVSAGAATITGTVLFGGVTKSATATVAVSAPGSANATVTTPSLTFSPATVTIPAGSSVTWQFSGTTHNVTFGALTPQGGDIPDTNPGNAASRSFVTAGSYAYQCTRHSGMAGSVVVQASGPSGQFASLSLTPATAFVAPLATVQLTATPLDGSGTPLTGGGSAGFVSTNPAAATVSGSGLVTGVANGTSLVVATLAVNGVTRADTTTVTVGTASVVVTLSASGFGPGTVDIAPGSTVVWQFSIAGNVTFEEEQPPGGNIPQSAAGARIARTFTAEGDYDYYSSPDRGTKGRIRVR